jgi:cyclic pyranopterin phosphate synthase
MKSDFTHFDAQGRPRMVDVSEKDDTEREAVAEGMVDMRASTRLRMEADDISKGDVIRVAEIAGIMAAKRTSDLIPLCHPLPLTKVAVCCDWEPTTQPDRALLKITATVKTTYRTGVEMEALTACATAALTVYDMCKAVDRDMTIRDIRVLYKSGGRSGEFRR